MKGNPAIGNNKSSPAPGITIKQLFPSKTPTNAGSSTKDNNTATKQQQQQQSVGGKSSQNTIDGKSQLDSYMTDACFVTCNTCGAKKGKSWTTTKTKAPKSKTMKTPRVIVRGNPGESPNPTNVGHRQHHHNQHSDEKICFVEKDGTYCFVIDKSLWDHIGPLKRDKIIYDEELRREALKRLGFDSVPEGQTPEAHSRGFHVDHFPKVGSVRYHMCRDCMAKYNRYLKEKHSSAWDSYLSKEGKAKKIAYLESETGQSPKEKCAYCSRGFGPDVFRIGRYIRGPEGTRLIYRQQQQGAHEDEDVEVPSSAQSSEMYSVRPAPSPTTTTKGKAEGREGTPATSPSGTEFPPEERANFEGNGNFPPPPRYYAVPRYEEGRVSDNPSVLEGEEGDKTSMLAPLPQEMFEDEEEEESEGSAQKIGPRVGGGGGGGGGFHAGGGGYRGGYYGPGYYGYGGGIGAGLFGLGLGLGYIGGAGYGYGYGYPYYYPPPYAAPYPVYGKQSLKSELSVGSKDSNSRGLLVGGKGKVTQLEQDSVGYRYGYPYPYYGGRRGYYYRPYPPAPPFYNPYYYPRPLILSKQQQQSGTTGSSSKVGNRDFSSSMVGLDGECSVAYPGPKVFKRVVLDVVVPPLLCSREMLDPQYQPPGLIPYVDILKKARWPSEKLWWYCGENLNRWNSPCHPGSYGEISLTRVAHCEGAKVYRRNETSRMRCISEDYYTGIRCPYFAHVGHMCPSCGESHHCTPHHQYYTGWMARLALLRENPTFGREQECKDHDPELHSFDRLAETLKIKYLYSYCHIKGQLHVQKRIEYRN